MAALKSIGLLLSLVSLALAADFPPSSQEELQALDSIKKSLQDPQNNLRSWIFESAKAPCDFQGVKCDADSRVISLKLDNFGLLGELSQELGKLVRLGNLSAANNSISGNLPKEMVNCRQLVFLDLAQNNFTGRLPDFLSELPELSVLDLSANCFNGSIPADLGKIKKLSVLSLNNNLLDGTLPPFLSNLSNLAHLSLAYNPFKKGAIPPEIFTITTLKSIWLTSCNLVGSIPDSLDRLIQLQLLDLAMNSLTGPFPRTVLELSNLQKLQLYKNGLQGPLVHDFGRMAALEYLDVSNNSFTGRLPQSLGALKNLVSLHLFGNRFTGAIPSSFATLPKLVNLNLYGNSFSGVIPQNLGSNGQLQVVDLSFNNLVGPIPANICSGGNLELLALVGNSLNGSIPESLGSCRKLFRLRVGNNQLGGSIPEGLWGSSELSFLELKYNNFEGAISPAIGMAQNLTSLQIQGNRFSGTIPYAIGKLTRLSNLDASENRLSGSLPFSILKMSGLVVLNLKENMLSGSLPATANIVGSKLLLVLNLKHNNLSGRIPDQICNITTLVLLDLSENQLTGCLPECLANMHMNFLNLSDNGLQGYVSRSFSSMPRGVFVGNPELCGDDNPDLKKCSFKKKIHNMVKMRPWLLGGIFGSALAVILAVFICIYKKIYLPSKLIKQDEFIDNSAIVTSFHGKSFEAKEIIDALTDANVIANGGAGTVYKLQLRNEMTVAVKMLPGKSDAELSGEDNGFVAEVDTLGTIRHRNIVKLWCCISGKDFNLLVYEYMSNGSLGDYLHGPKVCFLDWPTRYGIALDAARGIRYLHHDLAHQIIHRDIKSNNILLDATFNAYVADFGLARILDKDTTHEFMSSLAGSYGYIPPETTYTLKITQKGDVYSFGVVLLELLTGRPPTDPDFGEGLNIVSWVTKSLQSRNGWELILDSKLGKCYQSSMMLVLKIALLCTNASPCSRPTMKHVFDLLREGEPK